ncbi:MAG TPA: DUF3857 domain-containing protein [Candidatus Angelobacter sp.]|nr:DUF3857 domain-containing protein [Candidatus Angelobacter sp.]
MTEFKPLPGAEAVLLYYANEIDDVSHKEFLYSRIKILNDLGKRFATVEIPLTDKASVTDLYARTIHPDGSITEFTGQPFDKDVLRGRHVRIRVRAFTLAQVTPGSIIEYRYELHYGDKDLRQHDWVVQHDLFAVKEHLFLRFDKHYALSWVATNGLNKSPEKNVKDGTVQMDVENVPPFEAEDQMPPENGYRLRVRVFYTSAYASSPVIFWVETGRWWASGINYFIGSHKEIKEAAEEAVGNETDPEKKIRKLYARAQQIRNLTYERERTAREQKQEELKDPKNVVDVLKHGYGGRNAITMLFVAMARSLGFNASVVLVSSRESGFFDREMLSFGQLDSEMARVQVNGKSVFLDPGTRFCPYGVLCWIRTATAAMDMNDPGGLISTPSADSRNSLTSRSANLVLKPDGSAKGEVRIEFSGVDALEHRLSALDTDEAGRQKELEDQLKEWLPVNAKVNMTASAGWENENEGLVAIFNVEIPEYASAAGKRLLVPAALFKPKTSRVLKDGPRKYPVYYQYAFTEADSIVLDLPPGYTAETVSAPQSARTDFADFSSEASSAKNRVNMERTLHVNGILFPPDRYQQLREFFAKVQTADDSQTVLRQVPVQAQKAN